MKIGIIRILRPITLILILGVTLAFAVEPLQTQFGISGDVEVDLIKAKVDDGVLTAVFAYRIIGSKKIEIRSSVAEVYYLDKSEGKKYHVLTDTEDKWIAAPIDDYARIVVNIPVDGKKLVWFKFPAPPESVEKIDIVLPDALPFENIALSQ